MKLCISNNIICALVIILAMWLNADKVFESEKTIGMRELKSHSQKHYGLYIYLAKN